MESNSVVDIGWHAVGLVNGVPSNSDQDGWPPDYLEDSNGDGVQDGNDGTGDLDGDGVIDREDADPWDPAVGRTSVIIITPANGATIN
jgi:hypothetical protein